MDINAVEVFVYSDVSEKIAIKEKILEFLKDHDTIVICIKLNESTIICHKFDYDDIVFIVMNSLDMYRLKTTQLLCEKEATLVTLVLWTLSYNNIPLFKRILLELTKGGNVIEYKREGGIPLIASRIG